MVAPNYDGSNGFGGTFFGAYKQLYGPKNVKSAVYKNKWLLERLRKVDDFEGANYTHTIMYGDPAVGSTDFAIAQTLAAESSKSKRFTIWRGHEYAAINISAEEARASRSDAGSLLRKKAYETNRVLYVLGDRININIHGDGSGIRGTFSTGANLAAGNNQGAQAVITLDNPSDIVHFEVGQKLQVATNHPKDGTPPTLANSGAIVTVTARPVGTNNAAQLVVSSNLNVWNPGIATSTQYHLLQAGDGKGFGVNVLDGGISGLESWLPTPTYGQQRIAPGDNFWGVDRSVDERRLAGLSYAAPPGESYMDTFANIGALMTSHLGGGGENYVLLMQPDDLAKLEVFLQQYKRIVDDGSPEQAGALGYKPIRVRNQFGTFLAMADPHLPAKAFKFIDLDDVYLKTLDALPHLDDFDGNTSLRLASADGAQIRWRGWYQVIVNTPSNHLAGRFA